MNKKFPMLAMVMALLLSVYVPVASAAVMLHRADYMVFAEVGGPESVDGAYAYDTASFELLFNIYDTLMWFDVDRSLHPNTQGLVDQFVPSLATSWTIEDINEYDAVADETWLQKYTFTMRGPVTWHDGTVSSAIEMARHAEYSFERWILQDRSGGNVWLILSFTLGVSRVPHPPEATEAETELFAHKIDQAIQRSSDTLIIRRNTRKLPGVFLQTIAQGWASIYNKDWCVAHPINDWPGFDVTGYTWGGWDDWHDPAIPPMDAAGHPMMGTGPYKLDWLTMGVEWSIVTNEDYWGGFPAGIKRDPPEGPTSHGYFRRIKFEIVEEWTLRKAGLLDGTYDMIYVPNPNIPELVEDWGPPEEYLEGITCFQPLPVLSEQNIFFNYNVSTASLWCGPSFNPGAPYTWGDDRIPINFFDDVNVRKAFALIWDPPTYINEVLIGEAIMPASYHVFGLAYHNPTPEGNYGGTGPAGGNLPVWAAPTGTGPYPYLEADELPAGSVWSGYPNQGDPYGAEYYFKMAWGGTDGDNNGVVEAGDEGDLWTNGFRFTMTYVAGVDEWATACDMLKTAIEAVNPDFYIDIVPLEFGTEFLPDLFAQRLSLFVVGWLADYADPDNFAHPYMHTEGTIFYCQNGAAMTGVDATISIPAISWSGTSDQLIMDASFELDTTRREAMYHKLQEVFHDRVINIPMSQTTGRHWERIPIKGWYFNTLYPGYYHYHYYRRYASDTDYSGVVDMVDKWLLDAQWGAKWDPETAQNYRADINNDGKVAIEDKGILSYYQLGLVDPDYT